MGTRDLPLGLKRPGREADHSPPSSAEVKEWMELYLHSHNTPSWRGAQLKHRDSFILSVIILIRTAWRLKNWHPRLAPWVWRLLSQENVNNLVSCLRQLVSEISLSVRKMILVGQCMETHWRGIMGRFVDSYSFLVRREKSVKRCI
jgi:hypothetical protein